MSLLHLCPVTASYWQCRSLLGILSMKNTWISALNTFHSTRYNVKNMAVSCSKYRSITKPVLLDEVRKNIYTVLGIHIGYNIISWATLNSENRVLEWDYKSHMNLQVPSDFCEMIDMASDICSALSTYDAYVTEDDVKKCTINNLKEIPEYVQRQQLKILIISYLKQKEQSLNGSNQLSSRNKFYHLKSGVVDQFFRLRVGSEVKSTSRLVKKLFEKKENNAKIPNFYVNDTLMHRYTCSLAEVQEQMNRSLLIAIAFLHLGVFKRTDIKFPL